MRKLWIAFAFPGLLPLVVAFGHMEWRLLIFIYLGYFVGVYKGWELGEEMRRERDAA